MPDILQSTTPIPVPGPLVPIPDSLDIADGPAALLPDGNVLIDTSPGFGNAPTYFFEFDGTKLKPVPGPPNAPMVVVANGIRPLRSL